MEWEYKVLPIKTRVHANRLITEGKLVIDGIQNELNVLGKDG